MALLQSLHERLFALVPNGDQSAYARIVDHLENLQRFREELTRTAESGYRKNSKTFKSKQKDILTMSTQKGPSVAHTAAVAAEALDTIKNETIKSIKSMMNAFENCCAEYQQIMGSKSCILSHIKEIELLTKSNSQLISDHVQSAMDECICTKNNISMIVMNHDRVKCTNKTARKQCNSYSKNNMKNMEEQLEYQKEYYTDIINELKSRILSIEEKNQATFSVFSEIMSNVMNLHMKLDCIKTVYETSSKMYNKVLNLEKICMQIDNNLDLKIEKYNSDISLTKTKWKSFMSKWNDLQIQSHQTSDNISKSINEFIEMDKLLDELILQKTDKLENMNSEYKIIRQITQKKEKNMISSQSVLENLKSTLTTVEKINDTYRTQMNEQDTHERILLESISNLDGKIDELQNKTFVEIHEANNEDQIYNNYLYEFDLTLDKELKSNALMVEAKMKKIDDLEIEKHSLRQLRGSHVDMLKRNKRSEEESQTSRMCSEIDNRQKLSNLINKKMENTKAKILRYKTVFAESVYTNNELESCTKVLYTFLQNIMINNHGKSMNKLTEEEEILSAEKVDYAGRLRNSQVDTSQMEALLEERIQLLQERMKAITAQREQIEQANRGLEEELNKLSNKFVKMEDNVKVTDETEEEKIN